MEPREVTECMAVLANILAPAPITKFPVRVFGDGKKSASLKDLLDVQNGRGRFSLTEKFKQLTKGTRNDKPPVLYFEDYNPYLLIEAFDYRGEIWGRHVCRRCKASPLYIPHSCHISGAGITEQRRFQLTRKGLYCPKHGCLDFVS